MGLIYSLVIFQGAIVDNQRTLKALKSMIMAMENPDAHTKMLQRKKLIILGVSWLCLVLSMILYMQNLRGVYLPVLSVFTGVLFGMYLWLGSIINEWQIVAKHIDSESVKNEISDLEI